MNIIIINILSKSITKHQSDWYNQHPFYVINCTHGARVEIVLISLDNGAIPIMYKLSLVCTNNIAEHEVLVLGLKVAIPLKINKFKIICES